MCEELGVQQDAVSYEVIDEPGKRLFGMGGERAAKVRVWIKEDYPRMAVDWAGKTLSQGYCGYTATGNTDSTKLPDLIACPTCESPIFGDGNAGYPLGYADQTTCQNAKNPATGTKDFTWYTNATKPIYWIYGGAGLEGGPPMYEPGAQNYKCGRCHTSGWSADTTASHVSGLTGSMDTKLPFSATNTGGMFAGADFTTQTVAGGTRAVGRAAHFVVGFAYCIVFP